MPDDGISVTQSLPPCQKKNLPGSDLNLEFSRCVLKIRDSLLGCLPVKYLDFLLHPQKNKNSVCLVPNHVTCLTNPKPFSKRELLTHLIVSFGFFLPFHPRRSKGAILQHGLGRRSPNALDLGVKNAGYLVP